MALIRLNRNTGEANINRDKQENERSAGIAQDNRSNETPIYTTSVSDSEWEDGKSSRAFRYSSPSNHGEPDLRPEAANPQTDRMHQYYGARDFPSQSESYTQNRSRDGSTLNERHQFLANQHQHDWSVPVDLEKESMRRRLAEFEAEQARREAEKQRKEMEKKIRKGAEEAFMKKLEQMKK